MAETATDQQLLREYVERQSERAFQDLVQRHVGLVYATARRGAGDATPEITQAVFIALARKAAWLRDEASLVGWLHKTTLLQTRQWWRTELRRQRREQTAVELGTTMKDEPSLLNSIAGVLDEGLMELREVDRQALMLRFFEEQTHREIAVALGANEDAVRKRIDKALGQLTRFFQRRGYAVPAVATTVAALTAAAQAAPAGLGTAAAQAALSAAGAASAGNTGFLLVKLMGLTNAQTAALCLIVAAAPAVFQWRSLTEARSLHGRLATELTALRETIHSQEQSLGALEGSLQQSDARLAALAPEPGVNARRSASAPDLYRWDEQSDFVRLPKSLMSHLTFGEFKTLPRPKTKSVRVQQPPVSDDGTPSGALLNALGMTPEEAERVTETSRNAFAEFAALAAKHSYLTNQTSSPQGTLQRITLFTPAFSDDGIQQRYWNSLLQAIGPERTEAFWQASADILRDVLNGFGEAPHQTSVYLAERNVMMEEIYYNPDGSSRRTHFYPSDSKAPPEALKGFVDTLRAAVQQQARNMP